MGGISTMIFTNFNLRMSQFRKRGRLVWFLFKQKKMLEELVHPPSDAYARSWMKLTYWSWMNRNNRSNMEKIFHIILSVLCPCLSFLLTGDFEARLSSDICHRYSQTYAIGMLGNARRKSHFSSVGTVYTYQLQTRYMCVCIYHITCVVLCVPSLKWQTTFHHIHAKERSQVHFCVICLYVFMWIRWEAIFSTLVIIVLLSSL